MARVAALALAVILAAPSGANAVDLSGAFTQGGLVVGRTDPGAAVRLDGVPVRVGRDGIFLLGFGRDAPASAELDVRLPSGGHEREHVTIQPRQYQISRIDGLPSRQVTPDPEALARIHADSAAIGEARRHDSDETGFLGGFSWPVVGRVSGVYGSQRILNGKPRSPHNGVDVAAAEGADVRAPAAGVVTLAHLDMFYTGNTLILDHGHGLTSVYAHMNAIAVKDGQRVAKGDPIGKVGRTGRATGPHLHWGVTLHSTHLDPALLAGPMPAVEK